MQEDNTTVNFVTREEDGRKPTYSQLEMAYLKERRQREALEKAFKTANQSLAKLRYELNKIKTDDRAE